MRQERKAVGKKQKQTEKGNEFWGKKLEGKGELGNKGNRSKGKKANKEIKQRR